MPVFQKIVNFNEMFMQLKEPPIIINDISSIQSDDKDRIRNLITDRFDSDMVSILPSCQCGKTKGEFAIATICPHCKTPVKSIVEDDIEPLLWFRRPKGVAPLINPMIWQLLNDRYKIAGFSLLQFLADNTYRPLTTKQPAALQKVLEHNLPRGYNHFVENFDTYIAFLNDLKDIRKRIRGSRDYLMELIAENRHAIFSDYIPLPNKALLIIEKTNVAVYIDNIVLKAVDAIHTITSIDSDEIEHSSRVRENRTIKAISRLAEFYSEYIKNTIAGKPGQFRKHILGTRTNFNFRSVISSITGVHRYDEIYAPWYVGLTAFRPHLINKLLRSGYDLRQAQALLLGHVEKYHPLIDKFLQEMVREAPGGKGIVVVENRNPTMLSGSIQTKYITKFKPNPADHTVSTSILTVRTANSDFDGDALNYSISIDQFLADSWKTLEPHHNIFMADTPHAISDNISIPKPVISSISNWIHNENAPDPVKLSKMAVLFK